ncbi:MAG: Asp-tRNA(Asn)/Glu-tRNA(Gln) amidotransferase subunit GatC [Candidatus Coatesbacteria bacterium]|nr:Asp-tRNA(Asn)/Glu-tRNA(Gln) amidotransferase subunit GatC [Candidatus Coatesbacteria bacterium]
MEKERVTIEEVKEIAKLAGLSFDDNELIEFKKKFEDILRMVDKLQEIDTEDVEPLTYPMYESSGFAPDKAVSFENPEILINASSFHTNHLFAVKSFTARELKQGEKNEG